MKKNHGYLFLLLFPLLLYTVESETYPGDVTVMHELRNRLNYSGVLGWSGEDPCQWVHIYCDEDRIKEIRLGYLNIYGSLPMSLSNLQFLENLELEGNHLSGNIPSLSGLRSLKKVSVKGNRFSSIPSNFFDGLSSLRTVILDDNPLSPWEIPDSLRCASKLVYFSANSVNIHGKIPDFFTGFNFPSLQLLHLSLNNLEGAIPDCLSTTAITSLALNGQAKKLKGSIEILSRMTSLVEIYLQRNRFSGTLPDLSNLADLRVLNITDNELSGTVSFSLTNLQSLRYAGLSDNFLQGPLPQFSKLVKLDLKVGTNSFCLYSYGDCEPRVKILLSFASSLGYPLKIAQSWRGNNPCLHWLGISCDGGKKIIGLNFHKFGLTGTISPEVALLPDVQRIILSDNNLTGSIPTEFTTMENLRLLDVRNNHLSSKIPSFRSNVIVLTSGNPDIRKRRSKKSIGVIVGSVIGGIFMIVLLGSIGFCLYKQKQGDTHVNKAKDMVRETQVIEPEEMVRGTRVIGLEDMVRHTHIIEPEDMEFDIEVLRNATDNFSQEKLLGEGGTAKVYKGILNNGTSIAVKRMEGVMNEKALRKFKSEITFLKKIRHRHLVALHGYCLDGNERLLVFEYMPKGTLSQHLEGVFEPLDWTRRLSIALDVARGVEYLHGLAQQSYVHRDLKSDNILLNDAMTAKVADFGLVLNAASGSTSSKIAGTFGYADPDHAATGITSTKLDIYSFGVILMELITGKKAVEKSESGEPISLVSWFRENQRDMINFSVAIDPAIEISDETKPSIREVIGLAGHCCSQKSKQRPETNHVANKLASLVELWKPEESNSEGMDSNDMSFMQSSEGSSSDLEATSSFLAADGGVRRVTY